MKSNEPLNNQAQRREGTTWFWGSHEFVDFASNTVVILPPRFWFPCLPFQTLRQQHLTNSAWVSVDPCRGHWSTQSRSPPSGLTCPFPRMLEALAASRSQLNPSSGLGLDWRLPFHPNSCLFPIPAPGSWVWLTPCYDCITVHFPSAQCQFASLPHRYWSQVSFLHTNN